MADLRPFPDIETALAVLLEDLGATGIATPDDLASQLPFIRIKRYGGSDNRITDNPTVAIDAFAATRLDALGVAEAIRQRLITGPNVVVGHGVIDRAETAVAPNEVPWGDTQSLRRFTATYRLSVRR